MPLGINKQDQCRYYAGIRLVRNRGWPPFVRRFCNRSDQLFFACVHRIRRLPYTAISKCTRFWDLDSLHPHAYCRFPRSNHRSVCFERRNWTSMLLLQLDDSRCDFDRFLLSLRDFQFWYSTAYHSAQFFVIDWLDNKIEYTETDGLFGKFEILVAGNQDCLGQR